MVMDHRKQKDLMKALETPEEKRLRRIKKKEDKDKRKRAEMGWDQEMMVIMTMLCGSEECCFFMVYSVKLCG